MIVPNHPSISVIIYLANLMKIDFEVIALRMGKIIHSVRFSVEMPFVFLGHSNCDILAFLWIHPGSCTHMKGHFFQHDDTLPLCTTYILCCPCRRDHGSRTDPRPVYQIDRLTLLPSNASYASFTFTWTPLSMYATKCTIPLSKYVYLHLPSTHLAWLRERLCMKAVPWCQRLSSWSWSV